MKEHSVILTAQREPFYNREKRDQSPIAGTHFRRDTVIPQWFQASKAAAASDGYAVHC
jgi:hypothetical protein